MSSKSPPRRGLPVLGYTTRRHLILDLDNTTIDGARWVTKKIMLEWPKVGDCLILRSSDKPDRIRLVHNKWGRPLLYHDRSNFHLVFDNGIGYNLSCRICGVLAGLGILNPDYLKIRKFRGDMTLRVGMLIKYNEIKYPPILEKLTYNNFTSRRDGFIDHYLEFKINAERALLSLTDTIHVPDHGRNGPDRER